MKKITALQQLVSIPRGVDSLKWTGTERYGWYCIHYCLKFLIFSFFFYFLISGRWWYFLWVCCFSAFFYCANDNHKIKIKNQSNSFFFLAAGLVSSVMWCCSFHYIPWQEFASLVEAKLVHYFTCQSWNVLTSHYTVCVLNVSLHHFLLFSPSCHFLSFFACLFDSLRAFYCSYSVKHDMIIKWHCVYFMHKLY